MRRDELHSKISEVIYIEDFAMIDTLIAAVVANAIPLGDPVWLTLIGQSSGGKSQIIRPFAKGNPKMFLQIDDLSQNAFISGILREKSKIFEIKKGVPGIISMDDLTVLFSKGSEERNAVLSQFRMIYDGRLTRVFGNGKDSTVTWEGHAGMIAGSTPAIYRHFAEVADMGERFVMYRMKDVDVQRIVNMVMDHTRPVGEMDQRLSDIYKEYIMTLIAIIRARELTNVTLDEQTIEAIKKVAVSGTRLRTPVEIDDYGGFVKEIPNPESPIRVMKQLVNIAKCFMIMHLAEHPEIKDGAVLPDDLREAVEWIGYSISDDKRRTLFKAVMALEHTPPRATVNTISQYTNMDKRFVSREMVKLTAVNAVQNDSVAGTEMEFWTTRDKDLRKIVERLDPPAEVGDNIIDS